MQRRVLALLFLAGLVNFLDRGSLSVANQPIRAELHLSGTQMGALLSLFSLAYGFAQLPIGALLDRFRARVLLGLGLLGWSAAQIATAFVRSFAAFVPLRLFLGIGESPYFPAGMQAIEGWFPPRQRGWPTGVINASSMLGQAVAPPLLTGLMLQHGWRAMFAVIGGAGVLLALAWFPLYRDPLPATAVVPEFAAVETYGEAKTAFGVWLALFRSPVMWGMLLGFGGINYTAWLYLSWLPGYLEQARHVSIARTGLLAAVPFLMGACGMFLSGLVADLFTRKGRAPIAVRKLMIVLGMTVSAGCTCLVPGAATTTAAILLMGGALFWVHLAGTAAWGVVQFAAPPRQVATVASIQNFGSFMLASVAPLLTGWLLDRTHSFRMALMLCAGVTLLGALAYGLLVNGPIEDTLRSEPTGT
jgi:sugar phosphate permease